MELLLSFNAAALTSWILNPCYVFKGWSFQEKREAVSPVKRSPAMSFSVTAWTASSELIGDWLHTFGSLERREFNAGRWRMEPLNGDTPSQNRLRRQHVEASSSALHVLFCTWCAVCFNKLASAVLPCMESPLSHWRLTLVAVLIISEEVST